MDVRKNGKIYVSDIYLYIYLVQAGILRKGGILPQRRVGR